MKEHPVFARFYEWLSRAADAIERDSRAEVAGGARGRILELGAGNGLNFEHYDAAVAEAVVALEPEPTMQHLSKPRALEAPVPVRLARGRAETLPFPDAAFDTAVVSLVMCSVRDPRRAASELARVVRPGGEIRFFEHVRSHRRVAARTQSLLNPVWGLISAGCHLDRDTVGTLRDAGFEVEARHFPLGPPTPARPHVIGTARRP